VQKHGTGHRVDAPADGVDTGDVATRLSLTDAQCRRAPRIVLAATKAKPEGGWGQRMRDRRETLPTAAAPCCGPRDYRSQPMDITLWKIVVTPTLIALASLAGRRFGPMVSGWFVGLPLTSGPIAWFIAVSEGPTFARGVALGTLAGTISQVAFCLAYAWTALRFGWLTAIAVASAAFAICTLLLQHMVLTPLVLFVVVIVLVFTGSKLMPVSLAAPSADLAVPRFDIPLRMLIATGFVLVLTELAPHLGSQLTGLLAPYPLFGAVLAVFAHRHQGTRAALGVLVGLLAGLYGFSVFFIVVALLIEHGPPLAFAAAIVSALAIHGATLLLFVRHRAVDQ
jgi:hypothetical protein